MTYQALVLALVASVALAVGSAHAQQSQARQGVWGGFGFGYGSFNCRGSFDCHEYGGTPRRSFSGFFHIGGTVSARVLAGLEVNRWVKYDGDLTRTISNAGAVIFFYPSVRSGLRLKGGLGVSMSELSGYSGDIAFDDRAFGGVAMLGIGYDLRMTGQMSLTPGFNLVSNTAVGNFFDSSYNMWQLVVGLTWH